MGALSRWEYESEKDAEIEICVVLPNASSVTPLIVSHSHLPTPSDLFGPRHSQILGGFFCWLCTSTIPRVHTVHRNAPSTHLQVRNAYFRIGL